MTDLDLSLELLEVATIDDLPLSGLEAVDDRGDRSDVVGHREEDELLVDKVRVRDHLDRLVKERSGLIERGREERVKERQASLGADRSETDCELTLNCLSHSFRSSAFFLLNARSIRSRSPSLVMSNWSMCLAMSLKYFFASAAVEVPSPWEVER